jgi:hypothetical protein
MQHALSVILSGITIAGFTVYSPAVQSASVMAARAANVAPGDPGYPALNPHPRSFLKLVGRLPESLQIQFRVAYIADSRAGTTSNGLCKYRYKGESLQSIFILEPIAITRIGDRVSASVVRDRYVRGGCGWHFNGIQYALVNSSGEMTGDWFAIQYDPLRDGMGRKNLPRRTPKIWCMRNHDDAEPTRPELCSSMSHLQLVASIPTPLLAAIPPDDRNNRGMAWLFPGDNRVAIQFFDLDAMSAKSAQGN